VHFSAGGDTLPPLATLDQAERAARRQSEEQVQHAFMPLVRRGEALEADGEARQALALYEEALAGFQAAGCPRPKLAARVTAARGKLAER
jgi:hypothetical protein